MSRPTFPYIQICRIRIRDAMEEVALRKLPFLDLIFQKLQLFGISKNDSLTHI